MQGRGVAYVGLSVSGIDNRNVYFQDTEHATLKHKGNAFILFYFLCDDLS